MAVSMSDTRTDCIHIIHSLEYGGAQRVVWNYAKFHDRERYRLGIVSFMAGGGMAGEIERLGVRVRALGMHSSDPRVIRRLRRILAETGARIVHFHNPLPLFLGLPAASLARVPARVMTEHSTDFPGRGGGRLAAPLYRRLRRSLDAVIACSDEVARSHKRRIDPSRLITIPNGVDTGYFVPRAPDPAERSAAGAGTGDFLIAAVGSLTPQKGFDLLIEAVSRLAERGIPARLIVAGGGPLRKELEARARAKGIAGSTRFAGWIADVRGILAAADVVAGSSLREGLPLGVLEAMACGRPVVTTDVGGNREAVDDGITGLLVPPGDPLALAGALERLWNDRERRAAMGLAGRSRVEERFSARRMVRRTEELYARLLDRAATAK
ncbi:MAG: glycosyltransferase [Candidatus Krumholzibacteria bacterium]|nr:glycosyltransferase [Candidatus Krumholzibacteria bacterium]